MANCRDRLEWPVCVCVNLGILLQSTHLGSYIFGEGERFT